MALTCLTEELIQSWGDDRITDTYLCRWGFAAPLAFEPDVEATAKGLKGGGDRGPCWWLFVSWRDYERRVQPRSL